MQAILLPGLDLTYHFGYTHAIYTSGQLSSNGDAINLDGKHQVFTPDVTSMMAVQYNRPINEAGNINVFVRGEWFYFGKQYFNLSNTQSQSAYSLLNASTGISYKQTSLNFWFRNITGTKYVAYAYDFGAARLGDPFTFGVSLKYIFR